MDTTQRRDLLERYRTGYAAVMGALAGAHDADLDRPPADGGWTARMVAHHFADSEANAYVRLRRLLAKEAPVIVAYDEELWAARLRYDRPVASSIAVLAAVRAASLELLEGLDEAAWSRAGAHSDSGRYSVADWLRIYSAHAHDHADQIARARAG